LFLGLFYHNDGFAFDRLFWSWLPDIRMF